MRPPRAVLLTVRAPLAPLALLSLLVALVALLTVTTPPSARAAPGPAGAAQFWFDRWDVAGLWADGARGQGITIAEIDTGVNARLGALAGRILPGTDLGRSGDGRADRDVSPFGHGTAMASIMVARPRLLGITGLAPDAKVLPIAVPLAGTTEAGAQGQLPQAITYAADHGAKIINLSLGGKQFANLDASPCPADEQRAVYHALGRGAIVVASVGNTGPRRNTVEEPGACLGVVSVGAVDDTGRVARFSAREPYLTMVAPGVNVPTLGRIAGEAFSGDGTSQAAALVSAALALVWSRYPTLSADAVVARVVATLDHRGRPAGHDDAYGYGELDAGRAVRAHVPADAVDPVAAVAAPFVDRARAETATLARPLPPAATTGLRRVAHVPIGRRDDADFRGPLGVVVAGLGLVALAGVGLAASRRRDSARSG